MTPPYKIRKEDKALAKNAPPDGLPVTIEVGDGAAIPRSDDPGLLLAWKIALICAITLFLGLAFRQAWSGWLLAILPDALSGQWLKDWAAEPGTFREAVGFMLPDGLIVTFKVTVGGICVTLVFGFLTGLGRVSKNTTINAAASLYVEVVRGIPLLVQLFFIYYAVTMFIKLPQIWAAIMAFGFCYGAYMGEVIRGGIKAIDRGQTEAALSLGFSPFQAMRLVVLPQAMRTILPPVGNEFISLLKDSSLVSIVALADLTRNCREFVSTNYSYIESFTMLALIYLMMTLVLSKLVSIMETKLSHYERR